MQNQAQQVQSILSKMDKVVENKVILDFTKSEFKKENSQNVYMFPEELGHMLLTVYKNSLTNSMYAIKRDLIDDIREQNNTADIKKVLIHFLERREFIDNVCNDTLDLYKTENFVEPVADKAELPTEEEFIEENALSQFKKEKYPKVVGKIDLPSLPTNLANDYDLAE